MEMVGDVSWANLERNLHRHVAPFSKMRKKHKKAKQKTLPVNNWNDFCLAILTSLRTTISIFTRIFCVLVGSVAILSTMSVAWKA